MIEIIRRDPETDTDVVVETYDEATVEAAIRTARFAWTYHDGPVFALAAAEEEMPELAEIGASAGPPYSRRKIHAEGGFRR